MAQSITNILPLGTLLHGIGIPLIFAGPSFPFHKVDLGGAFFVTISTAGCSCSWDTGLKGQSSAFCFRAPGVFVGRRTNL